MLERREYNKWKWIARIEAGDVSGLVWCGVNRRIQVVGKDRICWLRIYAFDEAVEEVSSVLVFKEREVVPMEV